MVKQAKELRKGDKISLAGQVCTLDSVEFSDIGKQGKRKARLVLITEKKEKLIIVRPEDYSFETISESS